jgi:hypothetical protein
MIIVVICGLKGPTILLLYLKQEVVKRSGRDEPTWVVTHMCMETMLGISLISNQ